MPDAVVARAPGRVNLVGDHTDYTGGRCLPIAIDRAVEVRLAVDEASRVIRLHSEALGSEALVPIDVDDVAAIEPQWARLVAAVVARLHPAHGCAGTVRSDVPIGSGLSSSAALEVAIALALDSAVGLGRASDPVALAMLCREAEHQATAVPTGLLDQLAALFGRAGQAMVLDCSTNGVRYVDMPPADVAEVVVVPGAPRVHAQTGYRQRVDECRHIEARIGPLRDADLTDVTGLGDPMLRRRARHVVTENERVQLLAAALDAGDVVAAGVVMDDSHRSLRDDYGSSTAEVDACCADLRARDGVLGARITGGGWGGSVVALTRPGALDGVGHVVHAATGATVVRVRLQRPPGSAR